MSPVKSCGARNWCEGGGGYRGEGDGIAKGTFEWHRRHCIAKFPLILAPPDFVKVFVIYIYYALSTS
ncbi:hypothetical protein H6G48_18220 [Microcystis flos-aquae FACHB-1344]|uniref:Uncharacterized protein n=1 Tax=Microcystis flos-aquae FACHB-1344 TaxID=2692899 RepID=A0ABR8HY97_9CHRO|nr:hypothetical protein [Microcystis flos-aquae FACHB-1344]MCA2702174.1 hypothetical protein [Microcystis sp. M179S2]